MIENINKPMHELFFAMEEEFHLFELKSKNGKPFWDILRCQIFLELQFSEPVRPQSPNKRRIKIGDLIKYIVYFLRFLFTKCNDLFYANSRFKDSNNISYDPYFESTCPYLSKDIVVYETNYIGNKYGYDNIVFDIIPLLRKLKIANCFFWSNNTKSNIEVISEAIYIKFGVLINKKQYQTVYNNFLFDYYFFKSLFFLKKIKRVFVLQNGIQKGLFLAAKNLGIPCFEFQHGDIVDSTIVYNYNKLNSETVNNIVYPAFLLIFSNLWIKGKSIPSKCVEIGVDFMHVEKVGLNFNRAITIVSSHFHNESLMQLAIQIAKKNPYNRVFFKLHPAQFPDYQNISLVLSAYANIEVVAYQMNIRDLIAISDEFIAIYSTAIFEALQAGKIVYVYKRENYANFNKYFDLPNVYLFNDIMELSNIRNSSFDLYKSESLPQFFEKFNSLEFSKAILLKD